MKVYYDNEVDAVAVHLELGKKSLVGVAELAEGVALDMTSDDKIVGMEILDVSKKNSL